MLPSNASNDHSPHGCHSILVPERSLNQEESKARLRFSMLIFYYSHGKMVLIGHLCFSSPIVSSNIFIASNCLCLRHTWQIVSPLLIKVQAAAGLTWINSFYTVIWPLMAAIGLLVVNYIQGEGSSM